MNQEVGALEGGRDWGAIIPSFLDDYGLDPYEMRVYIRLARRIGMGGQCWESIGNMASACKMSRQKVKNCLALLVAAQMVKRIKRSGSTDLYELMPECHWVKASELDSLRASVTAYRTGADQKRQNIDQALATKQPSYVVVGYHVTTTELPGSHLPDYHVATTELSGSHLPDYHVATKESLLRNPIKGAHEGLPLNPPTPQGDVSENVLPETAKNLLPGRTTHSSPTPPKNPTHESPALTVPVEVISSAFKAGEQRKSSNPGQDELEDKLNQLLERYNRGEIGKLPEAELKMLAARVIGDTVGLYRKSGKVLSSAPNDIDRALLRSIALRDQQDFVYGTRLLAAMERTPSRWGELVELVAAWQIGDVQVIPTAAKQIARHEKLQQSKQSTFEAIKDL